MAQDNLEKWSRIAIGQCFSAVYNFSLTNDPPDAVTAEKSIGNSFDRFFLRLFHRPVTRTVVMRYVYHDRVRQSVESGENGCPVIEINVESSGVVYVQW